VAFNGRCYEDEDFREPRKVESLLPTETILVADKVNRKETISSRSLSKM